MRTIRYPIHIPPQEGIDLTHAIQSLLAKKIEVRYGKEKLLCTVLDIDQISIIPMLDDFLPRASAIVVCIINLDEEQPVVEIKKQKKR